MLLGTGLRCRCALSLPRPQPSRAAHSATTADPYAKLEAAWLRYAGPDAISRLHGLVTPRSVLTVGGSQLIGKSTLAGRLAAALSGEMQSAGRLFRNEAARRGISVPELSRSAMNNPQIDVAIEYSLACLIAGGLSSSTGPLVLEGRQPAVMARYVRDRLGKSECKSVYVTCSVREQALRFIEREAGKRYAVEAGASIPQRHFASLSEVEPYVKQLPLPAELRERVCNAFVDNENRDTDDRRRYVELYGTHELLDYRSATLYDIRIDTTTNTPQQTFEQAMKALQAVGIK